MTDHIFTLELYSFYTHAFTVSPTEEALAAWAVDQRISMKSLVALARYSEEGLVALT